MSQTFLERYRNGEHEQVWGELVALGSAVRAEPLYCDAYAVACEMMTRARSNIELLTTRLRELDFRFMVENPPASAHKPLVSLENLKAQVPQNIQLPETFWQKMAQMSQNLSGVAEKLQQTEPPPNLKGGWIPPDDDLPATLREMEDKFGVLPLTLRAWFEIVGQVDFMGDHPKLARYYQNGPMGDPLVVLLDTHSLLAQLDDDPTAEGSMLEIAPDACHKSNHSGGGSTGVRLSQAGFDGLLTSEDQWDQMYFVTYLRTCFRWGGFPGLAVSPEIARAAKPELSYLTQDLLAI